MISSEKPNPFKVLGLPTDATNEDIVERGQELGDLGGTDEEMQLYRWAVEQLITKSITRLEYELFEIPGTRYDNPEWETFTEENDRNPVNLNALIKETSKPSLRDFDMAALIRLFLDGLLTFPDLDIKAAVENLPFQPDNGPPPLEVRDVIFG
jgi:hypothetical protein